MRHKEVRMNRIKLVIVTLLIGLLSFAGINHIVGDQADAVNMNARDCNTNSIINCGALSAQELKDKYNENAPGDLPAVYNYFGINADMINGMHEQLGTVTRDGNVVVNGKVVATGAGSIGRERGDGSGTAFSVNGHTYYMFGAGGNWLPGTQEIGALVWFDGNGQYVGSIMTACGNAIAAKPVPVPVYRCNTLTATQITRTKYGFHTDATAQNGASISSYSYDFGDGSSADGGADTDHTYAKPGTYQIKVTVHVSVNGQTVNLTNCATSVTVAPEMCTVPGKEQYEKDSPECFVDKPSISITKTVNNQKNVSVAVGTTFEYEIVVKNTGNVALKDAVVTDTAPDEVTLLSASDGTVNGHTWTYTIASLGVGDSQSFTISAKYATYASGSHVNTVCVDTPTISGSPDSCDTAQTETSENIQICDLNDNTIKTIDRGQLDQSHMTTDTTKCKAAVVELPHTGMNIGISSIIGLGGIVGAGYAYIVSRRMS